MSHAFVLKPIDLNSVKAIDCPNIWLFKTNGCLLKVRNKKSVKKSIQAMPPMTFISIRRSIQDLLAPSPITHGSEKTVRSDEMSLRRDLTSWVMTGESQPQTHFYYFPINLHFKNYLWNSATTAVLRHWHAGQARAGCAHAHLVFQWSTLVLSLPARHEAILARSGVNSARTPSPLTNWHVYPPYRHV